MENLAAVTGLPNLGQLIVNMTISHALERLDDEDRAQLVAQFQEIEQIRRETPSPLHFRSNLDDLLQD